MSTTFDQQYSTHPNFNKAMMVEFLEAEDIAKLTHWLANAEPNLGLAKEALIICIDIEWIDGLNALWASKWLPKRDIITSSWKRLLSTNDNDSCAGGVVEYWLKVKTFTESHLSVNELNTLSINMLDITINPSTKSEHFWTVFLHSKVVLKGVSSEALFDSLLHHRYFNNNPNMSNNQTKYSDDDIKFYQQRIDDILNHGIDLSYRCYLRAFFEHKLDLFNKLMTLPQVKINREDAMLVFANFSIYYNSYKVISLKESKDKNTEKLEEILKMLIKKGLTPHVRLKAKDIKAKSKYMHAFNREGYIDLTYNTGFENKSNNLYGLVAYQIEQVDVDEPMDLDLYVADFMYAVPIELYLYTDKFQYTALTDEQTIDFRTKINVYFN